MTAPPRPRGRAGRARQTAAVLLPAAVLLVSACAGRGGPAGGGGEAPPAPSPASELLTSSLAALDSADHATAVALLEDVRDRCGVSPAGGRATLLLAAVHLDPRDGSAEPQEAAERAAEYLRAGVGPAWTGPVARVLYLEALDKGADPPDELGLDSTATAPPATPGPVPEGCRAPDVRGALASTGVLPSLPGTPMAVRLERLQRRVEALQEELERIRAILDEP